MSILDLKNEALLVLPPSNMIRTLIDLNRLEHVYMNKHTDDAIAIYRATYELISIIRDSAHNPNFNELDAWSKLIESIKYDIRIKSGYGALLNEEFMKDCKLFFHVLDDLNLLDISSIVDVNRITYNNIYINILSIEHKF